MILYHTTGVGPTCGVMQNFPRKFWTRLPNRETWMVLCGAQIHWVSPLGAPLMLLQNLVSFVFQTLREGKIASVVVLYHTVYSLAFSLWQKIIIFSRFVKVPPWIRLSVYLFSIMKGSLVDLALNLLHRVPQLTVATNGWWWTGTSGPVCLTSSPGFGPRACRDPTPHSPSQPRHTSGPPQVVGWPIPCWPWAASTCWYHASTSSQVRLYLLPSSSLI